MTHAIESGVDDDFSRHRLWDAIVFGAKVLQRWGVHVYLDRHQLLDLADADADVPTLRTWKLVEILSALAVLTKAQEVRTKTILNLGGACNPVHFIREGRSRYLWTQPHMTGDSRLGARPDLVITATSQRPTPSHVLQVVDSKSGASLGTRGVRGESAKGQDLRAPSYLVWCQHDPPSWLVDGAARLKIDLAWIFSFVEPSGEVEPERLLHHFAETIEESRINANFARGLRDAADEAAAKLLL